MIIAAFAGTGKTTFASMYPDKVIDFVLMPYKYYLDPDKDEGEAGKANFDNEMQLEWPYNYVEAIKTTLDEMDAGDEKKIILIPSDSCVLSLLREKGIEYSLCYPQRDAKEIYRQRYIDRGNTEDFLSIFIDRFDRFMDALESDPCGHHIVLQPEQYISDKVAVLRITEILSTGGTDVVITNWLTEEKNDEPYDAFEKLFDNFTYSVGPADDSNEGVAIGTKLSDVPKSYSNGPQPPDDEDYVCVATLDPKTDDIEELEGAEGVSLFLSKSTIDALRFSRSCLMVTITDALATLTRLGLMNKELRIKELEIRDNEEEVTAYIKSYRHEESFGLSVDTEKSTIIPGNQLLVDRESMEVLCQLGLLDKPIGGWHDDTEVTNPGGK